MTASFTFIKKSTFWKFHGAASWVFGSALFLQLQNPQPWRTLQVLQVSGIKTEVNMDHQQQELTDLEAFLGVSTSLDLTV